MIVSIVELKKSAISSKNGVSFLISIWQFFFGSPNDKNYEKNRQICNVQGDNSTWTEKEASKNSDCTLLGLIDFCPV